MNLDISPPRSEARGQAAILNALPAPIALLDFQGVIVSVNEAWRQFSATNVIQRPGYAIGLNYLQICAHAQGAEAAAARQFADGLGSVLGGVLKTFSIEYVCHSATEPRWFLLTVTALADGRPNAVLVMHMDITAHKRAQDDLLESERRFSDMLGNVELVSLMLDREGRITYCNEYLLRVTGWRREEVMGKDWFTMFVPPELIDFKGVFFESLLDNQPEAWHHENEILTRSGARRLIRWNNSVLRSGTGDVIGVAGIGDDITERKTSEQRITHLNRVYAMLSAINTLIVRVRDRSQLFGEACRVAVDKGGFHMAWIGMIDRSANKVVLVGSAGLDETFLTALNDHTSLSEDALRNNTLLAAAIRENKALVSNDTSDPQLLMGTHYAKSGVRSMALLPLMVADEAVGAFALYATQPEFFHAEEMQLLTELARDIAFAIDHINKQERLDYLAYYDLPTGLANRSLFHNRLSQNLHARGGEQRLIAAVLLDVERFRQMNETLGRNASDELLRDIGARLLRVNDSTAHLGGGVYGLMLRGARTAADVRRALAEIVAACFDEPFSRDGRVMRVACRAGIALYPGDGADADALLRNAEAAVRRSKDSGDRIVFYASEMNERAAEALAIETQLRRAIERREFVLHYQPKIELASGRICGLEALIRWNDPLTGLVPPVQFIAVLEDTGMIVEVGRWVVAQAFADLRAWSAQGIRVPRVAVNVSAIQLRKTDFVAGMIEEIQRGGDHPEWLEIEITESVLMQDVDESTGKLSILRSMGLTVAIDDFGTGYSSLSYLSRLPVDSLKIDRSFVTGMTSGEEAASIVSTIIALAHGLKLKVVAEGVETAEQAQLLKTLQCDEAQGYLFSKPLSGERIAALLRDPSVAQRS
jgi:PAS domain S-box-containing protein/diguanylate cyclase (GGDEF)-like protein